MPLPQLSLDVNDCLQTRIGDHGLGADDLEALDEAAPAAHEELMRRRGQGGMDFWTLPSDEGVVEPAITLGKALRERFSDVVVLGIGGSALGAKAVIAALGGPHHNLLPAGVRPGARVFFADNSDPASFASLLDLVDLSSTCFLAITKSGSTAETLSLLLLIRKELGAERMRDQVIAITDPEKGPLRRIAADEGWRSLPVPPGVGGRFSVLSAVGLVPVAAAGFDAAALSAGADRMRARCEEPAWRKNPAYLLGAVHKRFDERGRRVHVLFPYADALREVGDWYVQLWAESLGKGEDVGPTPLRAVGATDQHSLLQLLMEGPQDKLVSFVAVEEPARDLPIPAAWEEHEAFAYLGGLSLGRLLDAERRGTAAALAEAGRPSLTLRLPRLDAGSVGELLFLWEAATAFTGFLYGIEPFDQPGVEASKRITQALLGRKGLEEVAAGLEAQGAGDPAFILR